MFMAGRSVSVRELSEVVGVPSEELKSTLDLLVTEYNERPGGIIIEWNGRSASMHVRPEVEDKIMSLAPARQMSKAMLKTLAVIATEGPLKQSDLVKSRGNRVYYYVKKLLDEELITAKKAGRTKTLSTTAKFKDYFRIKEVPKVEAPPTPEAGEASAGGRQQEPVENNINFEMK